MNDRLHLSVEVLLYVLSSWLDPAVSQPKPATAGSAGDEAEARATKRQRHAPPAGGAAAGAAIEQRYIVGGINEVTKGLERGQLRLVLVCRSVRPAVLTQHLLLMAHTKVRGCRRACAFAPFASTVVAALGAPPGFEVPFAVT